VPGSVSESCNFLSYHCLGGRGDREYSGEFARSVGGVWGVRLVTFSKNNTKKSWLGYRVESRGRGML